MSYLDHLNESQYKAVTHKEGPLLVLAGPGSGKTRVLTYRIAYLIQEGVDPFQILALTFTNKAADEMKERIEKIVGPEARNLWMGTFHSVFARILRQEAEKIGYPKNFTIYDTNDSKSLLRSIIKEQELSTDRYKVNLVFNRISLAKNSLMSPKDYQQNVDLQAQDEASGRPKLGELYERYMQRCFKAGAMDFDDLLYKMYVLLSNHPKTLYKYQHQFKHILIDEFQDTNLTQYIIVKKLGDVFQNICVVGDDAQSIYGFRGANIENIINFEKEYPDLRKIKLERNYRSTKKIVKAANKVIDKNKMKLAKEIWTDNQEGEKIRIIKAHTDNEEGKLITNDIFETKMREHAKNKDFAIFYRTNAQSRAFEEALRKRDIPYQVFGGLSFYDRKEIKDFLAYLRVIVNPHDEEALKRIINFPSRGIGKTTQQKLTIWANKNEKSLWEVVNNIKNYDLGTRGQKAVDRFATMIKSFRSRLETHDAYELAMEVSRETGLLKMYYEDKSAESQNRYENLEELVNSIQEFSDPNSQQNQQEEGEEAPDTSLTAYLQQVSLVTDLDTKDESKDAVKMMTVHSAKGLEFPYVYVVGLEENLFPSQMALNSREELEEERRLFYVALTRAQKRVTFSYALNRYRYGTLINSDPSRFIQEVDKDCIEELPEMNAQGAQPNFEADQRTIPTRRGKRSSKSRKKKKKVKAGVSSSTAPQEQQFVPDDTSNLQGGMKVVHSRFGEGKVLNVEGKGDNKIATIHFPEEGQKKIMLKYAKMKIIDPKDQN